MRQHIEITFEGFWNEKSIDKIPHASGVYVVSDGLLDDDGTTVALERTIYIGESEDVGAAIAGSDMWDAWREQCGVSNITDDDDITTPSGEDNELFFSFAPVESPERERAAAAMIFEQYPQLNSEEEKTEFAYEDTKMNIFGKTGILNTDYEVILDYADAPPEDSGRTDEFMDN
ncbi:MAG: hypothetical protein V3V95_02195 [Thermodesulfobacteriota bacterium]